MKKFFILIVTILTSFYGKPIIAQPCLPNGITFANQTQIDSFQLNYPNCTEIGGYVLIGGDDITNLNGLSAIALIGSMLEITDMELLTNLSGFENLKGIGNGLSISSNQILNSLMALDSLTSVGGDIFIMGNDSLTNLFGLENINSESIIDLTIIYNKSLSNCTAQSICNYLSNPNGRVRIAYNAPGCNNPPEIADECNISLPCLPYGEYTFYTQVQIDSFQSNYPNCIELEGHVRIRADVSNLFGLNNVKKINGNLSIEYTENLSNFEGLDSISFVDGTLYIWENLNLSSFSGLLGLDSVDGGIWIKDNYALTNLTGLDSVSFVGGPLTIEGNNNLTELYGLDHVDYTSISDLLLADNQVLSKCDAESICNYLANTSNGSTILNNDAGCNSRKEIEEACLVGVHPFSSIESKITLFPNPTSKEVNVLSKDFPYTEINIYNQFGQKVLSEINLKTRINVSSLKSGIYVIELVTNETRITEKLIILKNLK